MAEKSPYNIISDLRGGINDADSPFAIEPNQVVDAKNMDFRLGMIGTKRGGMTPLSMAGSVFGFDRPRQATINQGGFSGAASGNFAVSAYANVTDGTGATNHILLVFIATKAATAVTAVTYGGVALTDSTLSLSNGAAGRISVWFKTAPSVAGGSLVITLAGAADCSAIAVRYTEVDNGVGLLDGVTSSATSSDFQLTTTNLTPKHLFFSGIAFDGAGAVGFLGPGNIANGTQSNGTARVAYQSTVGQKAISGHRWVLQPSVAYAAARFGIQGRAFVTTDSLTRIVSVMRHQPTNDLANDELWAQDNWGRLDRLVAGVWQGGVPMVNAGVGSFIFGNQGTNGVSLHAKFFLVLAGGAAIVDRVHVWDGTVLRWGGFTAPAAPTGANTGGAGTYASTRYFRVRWTEQVSGVTVRRSEPSAVLTFVPSGANTGTVVTEPNSGTIAGVGGTYFEGATHWELEASLDNVLFYRIATTIIATTTVTDLVAAATGYAASGTLSESIGEYTPMQAVRHVFVDGDRLLGAGNQSGFANAQLNDSRAYWTVLRAEDGVGNDERVPVSVRHFLDLDGLNGGRITMAVSGSIGAVYLFKLQRIYKMVRTGQPAKAYDSVIETQQRGSALRCGTEAIDENGQPCVYFWDPNVGACRFSSQGVVDLMQTRRPTMQRVNKAIDFNSEAVFVPKHWLVWYFVALDSSSLPNYVMCYNIRTKGWTDYTGPMTTSLRGVLFPPFGTGALTPILAPVTLGTSVITIGDSGVNDDGVRFRGYITTKPMQLGQLFKKFGVQASVLFAKVAATTVGLALIRNLGLERKDVTTSIAQQATETYAVRPIDDAKMSECFFIQYELGDPLTYAGAQLDQTWTLDELSNKIRSEDEATG